MAQATSSGTQLAFIDTGVAGWQQLALALSPLVEVQLLDSDRDGLSQIANVLETRSGIGAIHVYSHGAAGALSLGNIWLTSDSLSAYEASWSIFRNSLLPGADLLLYGCNVGYGAIGRDFVERIAVATGADVAASINVTGAAALSGDWMLELEHGPIHTGAIQVQDLAHLLSGTPDSSLGWIILGTDADETLTGSGGNDSIEGRGGNDVIEGGDGDDTLSGGPGDDRISGGDGRDMLSGGDGRDMLSGGDGVDSIDGGSGSDTYWAGEWGSVSNGANINLL